MDDRLGARDLRFIKVLELLAHALGAGQHTEHVLDRAHVLELLHLGQKVFERERVCRELLCDLARLFLVEILLSLLDEGEDVTQIQDAARHAIRVERLEVVQRLPRAGKQDRTSRDAGDRQRGATPGVTVEFGQHDTREVDTLLEGASGGDGILTDHGVDDKENLVWIDRFSDVGGLFHELGVYAQPACGVDDDHVVLLAVGFFEGFLGDLDRITLAIARLRRVDGHPGLLAHDLQLCDGVGSLKIGGDQHGGVTLGLEPLRQLAGERGLTCTLEAGEHDDRRPGLGKLDATGLAPENRHQFIVDDLHDLLRRVQRL